MCSAFFFTKSPYQPRCLNHLGTNLKRKHPIPEFIYFQAVSIHKGGEIQILIRPTKLPFFFSFPNNFSNQECCGFGVFLEGTPCPCVSARCCHGEVSQHSDPAPFTAAPSLLLDPFQVSSCRREKPKSLFPDAHSRGQADN